MRAITRVVDCSINTVNRLLITTGKACLAYQDKMFCNLPCKSVQVDEIWSFCHTKKERVKTEQQGVLGFGDLWTWTAICADSRLMIHWHTGTREIEHAHKFISGLRQRVKGRIQLSSDGHSCYLPAVEEAFGADIDFGILNKQYANKTLLLTKMAVIGRPKHISTSRVERANLNIRSDNKRFARRTNAHSKKLENHELALALYFMYYNYVRINQTLRITPAMAAGLSDHIWGIEDILALGKIR